MNIIFAKFCVTTHMGLHLIHNIFLFYVFHLPISVLKYLNNYSHPSAPMTRVRYPAQDDMTQIRTLASLTWISPVQLTSVNYLYPIRRTTTTLTVVVVKVRVIFGWCDP